MILIYGQSKSNKNHPILPHKDIEICEALNDFSRSIVKAMAKTFPGEFYYAYDTTNCHVIYSYIVEEKEEIL